MVKIREAIIVEGRYDINTLSQIVDAPILETHGFSVMKDKQLLALIRTAAQRRGIIILTDSDGAGFQIRNFLKGAIPGEQVKHAYIPDILGKEKRKTSGGKEGKLGVEGMKPQVILEALRNAGATFEDSGAAAETGPTDTPRQPITKQDLYALQLIGYPDSAARRAKLKQALSLPEHLSTNALLDALNLMFDRDEFLGEDE